MQVVAVRDHQGVSFTFFKAWGCALFLAVLKNSEF